MLRNRGHASVGPLPLGDETSDGAMNEDAPVDSERLMERVVERDNLIRALRQVKRNRGGPGMDGMRVEALPGYLKGHWPAIKASLTEGTYQPQPVRGVSIPKPGGGVRWLGIPTVLDRFIQQALLHVLQADWEGSFSDHSYGFRPSRSAHQAVSRAQGYLHSGYSWVVDIDLEQFLDAAS